MGPGRGMTCFARSAKTSSVEEAAAGLSGSTSVDLFMSVEVRLAALAGVVEEHGLELREEVQAFFRHLAVAHPGAFHAAERDLRLAADGRAVDVDHAGLDAVDEVHDVGQVLAI